MVFKIKICGITNVADALFAADAGADAIGLNFYSGSKRCVSVDVARQIVDAIDGRAEAIGVFVNASADSIRKCCEGTTLSTVQLHGERPELLKLVLGDPNITVIHAHSFGPRGMDALYEDMFDKSGSAVDGILVDTAVAGMYGGTGQTIDWNRLVNYQEAIGQMPLILAGGLVPANVAEAIHIVRPQAVDTASGVESEPGTKDVAKMRDFVAAAREAFAAL